MFSFLPTNYGFTHKYHCDPRPHQRGLGIFAKCHSFAATKVPERGLFGQHWQSSSSSFMVTNNFKQMADFGCNSFLFISSSGWFQDGLAGSEQSSFSIRLTRMDRLFAGHLSSHLQWKIKKKCIFLVLFATRQFLHVLTKYCFHFVFLKRCCLHLFARESELDKQNNKFWMF